MREFNPVVSAMEPSVTLFLNAKAKELSQKGQKIYNLTAGEPDYPTPEYIQKAVAKSLDRNKYTPASGLPKLRESIAKYGRDLYKADWIKKENVVVTPGAKPALFSSLMAVLSPEEEVIVPIPAWVSYKQIIEIAGGIMVPVITTENFGLDVDEIAKKITPKTKVILLNSPNNPTGAVYSEENLKKLAELIKDKDICVLSDDIYIRLSYEKVVPITTCGFEPEKLIIVNGFSKSQALTGWRIGYVITSQKIASMIGKLNSHILGNTSLPGQYAALAALEQNDDPPMLNQLKKRRKLAIEKLAVINKVSFVKPQGAFYVFLNISQVTVDDVAWCEKILENEGVALVPGTAFGAPGFVRMSFTAPEDELIEAIKLIGKHIKGGNK